MKLWKIEQEKLLIILKVERNLLHHQVEQKHVIKVIQDQILAKVETVKIINNRKSERYLVHFF